MTNSIFSRLMLKFSELLNFYKLPLFTAFLAFLGFATSFLAESA